MRFRNLTAVVLTMLAACPAGHASADQELPVVQQWSGQYGGAEAGERVVVTTPQQWRDVWARTRAASKPTTRPAPDPPAIDFAAQTALAVFMGRQRTGGYRIEVTRVERARDGSATAYVRETRPGRDDVVTTVLTSPWHVVVIDGKVEATSARFVEDAGP